jgi:hypothetical protein
VVIVIITFTFVFPVFHYSPEERSFRKAYNAIPDPDSIYSDQLKDSLPYRSISDKLDSIRLVTSLYESYIFDGFSFGNVGSTKECDTCEYRNMRNWFDRPNPDRKYYFVVADLEPVKNEVTFIHEPIFFKKKGKFYKKYLVPGNSGKGDDKNYVFSWKIKEEQYGIRPSVSSGPSVKNRDLLFPISKTAYYVLGGVFFLIGFVFLVLFLSVIRYLILFVFQLSKGKAFTIKNYTYLFFVSYVLMGSVAYALITKYIQHLILKKYYSTDFMFYFNWEENAVLLLTSLLFLLLARAIKKGYEIEEEQNLTI